MNEIHNKDGIKTKKFKKNKQVFLNHKENKLIK